jgi:Tfp pilus assembly protein PilN
MTAVADHPAPAAAADEAMRSEPGHLIRISANLLPEEIVAARRLVRLKRKLVVGLAGLVVVLVTGYGYSWWQTNNTQGDLANEEFASQQLTRQLQAFTPLVDAQTKTTLIRSELATAMTNDLQWTKLIGTLNQSAGSTVQITSMDAQITADSANGALVPDANPLNDSGLQVVGNLTLTGSANDYRTVAAFVDTLSTVKGLAVVDPAEVTTDHGNVTFSVTLSLTTDALGGRFSAPANTGTSGGAISPTAPAAPTGGQ